ncbi:MAG: tetratricopeptide repeat protein [Sporichthyaceae bacterium]|nr:tetratricopeptide repeat protein [Sporichthyaceae bacterium]
MTDTDTSLARIRALVETRRWAEARQHLTSVLSASPDSAPALCLLAQCELGLQQPEAARRAAAAAIAAAPDEEWGHRLHALALSQLGRHDQAIAAATEAVRLAPDLSSSHWVLGHALLGSPTRAKEAYPVAQRVVALDPHDADGFVLLGLAADKHKRRDEERAAYHKALELDPDNAAAMNNLAAMDLNRGRLGRAARQVTAALQMDPHEQVLRANLDQLALRLLGRLLNAMLLSGFVLLLTIAAESSGDLPTWWPRAIAGTLLLATYATIAWLTLRHLPAGSRRYLRGLPGRLTGKAKLLWIVFLVLSAAMLVAAFAPGDAAGVGAVITILIIRGFQIALVVMIIRWVVNKVRGRS